MTNWITNRRPTKEDADNGGGVWVSMRDGGDVERINYEVARMGSAPWMPIEKPEPYKPPIDTSLAASIERVAHRNSQDRGMACGDECDCRLCDTSRIIEAARQVDDLKKQLAEIRQLVGPRDCHGDVNPNDETPVIERVRQRIKRLMDDRNEANQRLAEANRLAEMDVLDVKAGRGAVPDPGEGWRLIDKEKDQPQMNDQWYSRQRKEWMGKQTDIFESDLTYRRRIEANQ